MLKVKLSVISALAILGFAQPVLADSVPVKNGAVTLEVSSSQISRLYVRGDKIVSVRTMDDPNGPNVLVQNDPKTGDVYVGFDGGDVVSRTFTIYLVTGSGDTIQVVLHPEQIEPKTYEVIDTQRLSSQGSPATPNGLKHNGYSETLVAFAKVMFNGDPIEGIDCQDVATTPQKSNNLLIYTVRECTTDGVRGVVLQLQNVSTVPVQITPDQFLIKHVLAAGVSNEMIKPGDSSRVYIEEEAR